MRHLSPNHNPFPRVGDQVVGLDNVPIGRVNTIGADFVHVTTAEGPALIPLGEIYACAPGRTTTIFNGASYRRYLNA